MDVRLIVEKGSTRIRTLRLSGRETVVGRRHGCGLRIPSAQVSRRHCVLRLEQGYVTVEDLNSANGTYLNGQRLQRKEAVCPGDHLGIGPVRFLVEYELTPAARERLRRSAAGSGRLKPEEDLPLAEEVREGTPDTELLEVLPVTPEDEAQAPGKPAEPDQKAPARPKKAKALDGAVDDSEHWQLPASDALRDILTQLEESDRHPNPRR